MLPCARPSSTQRGGSMAPAPLRASELRFRPLGEVAPGGISPPSCSVAVVSGASCSFLSADPVILLLCS